MIEVLVTVSIIIALLGIGVVAGTKFIAEGKKEQCKAMMNGLLGANNEFMAIRQQGPINHEGITPIDWSNYRSANTSIKKFVTACQQLQVVEAQMMAAVKSGNERTNARIFNERTKEIKDPWGTPLEYRAFNTREQNLPLSKTAFFVSAGPDKKFGTDDDLTTIQDPVYLED